MDIDIIEKPSPALVVVGGLAAYSGFFVTFCSLWLAFEIAIMGRFDPKFGRLGSFAAEVLMSFVQAAGALLLFIVFRRFRVGMRIIVVQACTSAAIALVMWKTDRVYSSLDALLGAVGLSGNLILLLVLIGSLSSFIVESTAIAVRTMAHE